MITQDMVREFLQKASAPDYLQGEGKGFEDDFKALGVRTGIGGALKPWNRLKSEEAPKPKVPKSVNYEKPKAPAAKPTTTVNQSVAPVVTSHLSGDTGMKLSDGRGSYIGPRGFRGEMRNDDTEVKKGPVTVSPQSQAPATGDWNKDFLDSSLPQSKALPPEQYDERYKANEKKIDQLSVANRSDIPVAAKLQQRARDSQRSRNMYEAQGREQKIGPVYAGQKSEDITGGLDFVSKPETTPNAQTLRAGTVGMNESLVKKHQALGDPSLGTNASGDPAKTLEYQLDEEASRGKRLAQKPVFVGKGSLRRDYAPQISQGGGRFRAAVPEDTNTVAQPASRVHDVQNDPDWHGVEDLKTGKISYVPRGINYSMISDPQGRKQFAQSLVDPTSGISAEDVAKYREQELQTAMKEEKPDTLGDFLSLVPNVARKKLSDFDLMPKSWAPDSDIYSRSLADRKTREKYGYDRLTRKN